MLRQQVKPDHRVHGIVEGKNWVPNGTRSPVIKAFGPLLNMGSNSYSRLFQNALAHQSTYIRGIGRFRQAHPKLSGVSSHLTLHLQIS